MRLSPTCAEKATTGVLLVIAPAVSEQEVDCALWGSRTRPPVLT
jgi:hypothetical protein